MVITSQALQYPDSDGLPMSDNTEQFRWIVYIKEGLDWLFVDDPGVFVAGDLLWYPVEGDNKTRQAPDAMVAFGRPKGRRGSYRQWEEGNVAPQVVFEVLSPGNTLTEMGRKLRFYERFGVEEYYLYDPDRYDLAGFVRQGDGLDPVEAMQGWVSPRLGVRFALTDNGDLSLIRPDGRSFESYQAVARRAEVAEKRAEELTRRLRELGLEP
ncbi:Uma2 family endonuclease [Gloeobacter morelensis]|uniref:Uma2 family endonuclease n=1 Tax=Gloeobacter morelensis MG652769 TaxID=2781736 RepID=A0ABY3PG67_9CYAN|nr:Uma2 family endonuclease [Gloeobacter morelensis]UFP92650.1 Uma2 family endonuclease [Gloeobacter morelensis MG652769]